MINTQQISNRNTSMDVLRIIACLMVITNHVFSDSQYVLPLNSVSFAILTVFSTIDKEAACVFFMLAGYFSKLPSKNSSVRKGIHYICLFFVADIFYSALSIILEGKVFSLSNLIYGIWNFKYHLWFLTAFAGVTFLSPVLCKIENSDLPYCTVVMFVFCVLLPSLASIFPNSYAIVSFSNILNGVITESFIFIGYFLLGRLFRIKKSETEKYKLPACIILLITYIIASVTTLHLSKSSGYVNEASIDNNSIFVFIESICLFTIFPNLIIKENKIISFLVPLTLSIYILHVAFVDILSYLGFTCLSFGDGFMIIIGIAIKEIIVFILSVISSILIIKFKNFLKHIVSLKTKTNF